MATIGQLAIAARDGLQEKQAETDKYMCFVPEWTENRKGQKIINKFNLNTNQYLNLLKWLGFRRYDTNGKWIIIRVIDNVAEECEQTQIADAVIKHIKEMPPKHEYFQAHEKLLNYVYNSTDFLFNKNSKLQYLYDEIPIIFNKDTEKECFFYYKNGFVTVTKEGLQFKPYHQMQSFTATIKGEPLLLKKTIWKSQLLDRDFKKVPTDIYTKFDWYIFLKNISQKEAPERLDTLMRLLGYTMHGFMEMKLKAVILTDSTISEKAEGRSGKTLLGKAVQEMVNPKNANEINRVASELNGKNFKADDTFRYQTLGLSTRIVILNDVKPRFKFDQLFNDITEGLDRTRKTEAPVKLYCKFLIPTNETIELPSGSYRDRAVEYELSNHYNDKWEPMQDFGKRFFAEWTDDDWCSFDNIMLECVRLYLEKGMPTTIKSINLEKRKVLGETSPLFVEFMDIRFFGDEELNRIAIIPLTDFDDKGEYRKQHSGISQDELYNEYLNFNSDATKQGMTKTKFNTYIKKYVLYSEHLSKVEEHRSNSVKKYYFFNN